jgi:hypothetical protein
LHRARRRLTKELGRSGHQLGEGQASPETYEEAELT